MREDFIVRDIYQNKIDKVVEVIDDTKKSGNPSVIKISGPVGRGKTETNKYIKEQLEKMKSSDGIKNHVELDDFKVNKYSKTEYKSLLYLAYINLKISLYVSNKETRKQCQDMAYLWNDFAEKIEGSDSMLTIKETFKDELDEAAIDFTIDSFMDGVENIVKPLVETVGEVNPVVKIGLKLSRKIIDNKYSNIKNDARENKYSAFYNEINNDQSKDINPVVFKGLLLNSLKEAVYNLGNNLLVLIIDNVEIFHNENEYNRCVLNDLLNLNIPVVFIVSGRKINFEITNQNTKVYDLGEIEPFTLDDLMKYFVSNNVLVDSKTPSRYLANCLLESTAGNELLLAEKIAKYIKTNKTQNEYLEICDSNKTEVTKRIFRKDLDETSDVFQTMVLHAIIPVASKVTYYNIAEKSNIKYVSDGEGAYLKEDNGMLSIYGDILVYIRRTINEKIETSGIVRNYIDRVLDVIKQYDLTTLDVHEAASIVQGVCYFDTDINRREYIESIGKNENYASIKTILDEAIRTSYFDLRYLKKQRGKISDEDLISYYVGIYKYFCQEVNIDDRFVRYFQETHYEFIKSIIDKDFYLETAIYLNMDLIKRIKECFYKKKEKLIEKCCDNIVSLLGKLYINEYPYYKEIKESFISELEDIVFKKIRVESQEKIAKNEYEHGTKIEEDFYVNYILNQCDRILDGNQYLDYSTTEACDHFIHLLSTIESTDRTCDKASKMISLAIDKFDDVKKGDKYNICRKLGISLNAYINRSGLSDSINEKLLGFAISISNLSLSDANGKNKDCSIYIYDALIQSYIRNKNCDEAINLLLSIKEERSSNLINSNQCFIIYCLIYAINNDIESKIAFIELITKTFSKTEKKFTKIVNDICNNKTNSIGTIVHYLNLYFGVAANINWISKDDLEKVMYQIETINNLPLGDSEKYYLNNLIKEIDSYKECLKTNNDRINELKIYLNSIDNWNDCDDFEFNEIKKLVTEIQTCSIESFVNCKNTFMSFNNYSKITEDDFYKFKNSVLKLDECSKCRMFENSIKDYDDKITYYHRKQTQLEKSYLLTIIYLLSKFEYFKGFKEKIFEKVNNYYTTSEKNDKYYISKSCLLAKIHELLFIISLVDTKCNNPKNTKLVFAKIFDSLRFIQTCGYENIRDSKDTEMMKVALKQSEFNMFQIDKYATLVNLFITQGNNELPSAINKNNKILFDYVTKEEKLLPLASDDNFIPLYFGSIAYNTFKSNDEKNNNTNFEKYNIFENQLEDLEILSKREYYSFTIAFVKYLRSIGILSGQQEFAEQILKTLSSQEYEDDRIKNYIYKNLYQLQNTMSNREDDVANNMINALNEYVKYMIQSQTDGKKIKDIYEDIKKFLAQNPQYKERFVDELRKQNSRINRDIKNVNRTILIDYLNDEMKNLTK